MEAHEKATQDCLTIEENIQALNCLKKVVRESGGSSCPPQLVLLVQDGCIPCKEETSLHAADIANGTVRKVNIATPEGLAIAKRNEVNHIPALLLLDCQDNIIEPA